jgi:uncharacterized protein YdeI (YjbR/CyaY-like superfamily)
MPLQGLSFEPDSPAEWRAWLETNGATETGVWLVIRKKAAANSNLSVDEAIDEALCFGWIDSKPARLDELRSALYFSPRKPKSGWSAVNKRKIERLMAEGKMAAPGLKKIDLAKAAGSWTKLDAVDALEIPPDLSAALRETPDAEHNFEAFPRSVKRGILDWITQAKKPETRAKRVHETAELAGRNERANQWKPEKP